MSLLTIMVRLESIGLVILAQVRITNFWTFCTKVCYQCICVAISLLKENDKVRLLRVQNNSSTKHHSKVLHAVAEHVAAGKKILNVQNVLKITTSALVMTLCV